MARDAGARFALVGHSERRHVFGETDEQTALKCAAAARNGLTPILCVGELLAQREAGETETVVLRQLRRRTRQAFVAPQSHRWRSRTSRSGPSEPGRPRRRTTRRRCTRRSDEALHARVGEAAADDSHPVRRQRQRGKRARAARRAQRRRPARRRSEPRRPRNGRVSAALDGKR